jgi:hypothetical protein
LDYSYLVSSEELKIFANAQIQEEGGLIIGS